MLWRRTISQCAFINPLSRRQTQITAQKMQQRSAAFLKPKKYHKKILVINGDLLPNSDIKSGK